MRRFPSSWDRTLTALGFRRKTQRVKRQLGRRCGARIENLERRDLLTASAGEMLAGSLDEYDGSATVLPVGPIVFSPPEFVVTGAAAGDTPEQFTVRTEYDLAGRPRAVITLKDGLGRVDRSLQTLQLQLRQGNRLLSKHEVLIDLAESRFVYEFQQGRQWELRDIGDSSESTPDQSTVQTWLTGVNAEGRFADLKTSGVNRLKAAESLDRVTAILKATGPDLDRLQSADEWVAFYNAVEASVKDSAAHKRLRGVDARTPQDERAIGKLALELGERLARDAISADAPIAAAAARAKDQLLAAADPYYTIFAGFGANRRLALEADSRGRADFSLDIVEAGAVDAGNEIRVELGAERGMVQTRTTWRSNTGALGAAASQVQFEPTRDASISAAVPTTTDDTSLLSVAKQLGAFVESGGVVSIEAEHFHNRRSGATDDWGLSTYWSGASNGEYLAAVPDDGTSYGDRPDYLNNAPRTDYEVEFSQAGTYYLWFRGYHTGGNDDSAHFGLNGVDLATGEDAVASGALNTWLWHQNRVNGSRIQITVPSAGRHTVNMWMREDGARVDKIVLTQDANYTPTGTGPAESGRSTDFDTASLLGFDLSAYAGNAPTSATLRLTPSAADGTSVSISAHSTLTTDAPLWNEASATYSDYENDLESGFGGTLAQATPAVGAPTVFDVTETVQRALLLGDSNLNGVLDLSGANSDIEAFHLAATDYSAYTQLYAGLEVSGIANGYLYRNDANVDGLVDATDAASYFQRVGVSRGDFNLDGVVDGEDYALWSANYGESAGVRFGMGDGNFNAAVDAGDYTLWADAFSLGESSTAPANPDVTFRLLADALGAVAFASSESATPPQLTVELAPRLLVQSFDSVNGRLRVAYEVQNETAIQPTLAVYQVVDGVRTTLVDSINLSDSIGVHEHVFAPSFSIDNPSAAYTLVAEVTALDANAAWRPFDGGVFETADGAVHAYGTAGADTLQYTNGTASVNDGVTQLGAYTQGAIDFRDYTLTSVSGQSYAVGGYTPYREVRDDGATLYTENNDWPAIHLGATYNITPNTVLEFDYESTVNGEFHGFALDDDLNQSGDRLFRLHGTQGISSTWQALSDPEYVVGEGVRHYRVRVGDFYTGGANYLYFGADNDAAGFGNSSFSNVRLYEGQAEALDFGDYTLQDEPGQTYSVGGYTPGATVLDSGATLLVENNATKVIELANAYPISPNTVIEFDYQSDAEGEVHGIRLKNSVSDTTSNRFFHLHGTQAVGANWQYAGPVPYVVGSGPRHYKVPIGQAVTGTFSHLAFLADNDAGGFGESRFSNVKIYEDVPQLEPEVYLRSGSGDDVVTVGDFRGGSVHLDGGFGGDLYALYGSVDASTSLTMADAGGLDELQLIGWAPTTSVALDDGSSQPLYADSASESFVSMQAAGNSIEAVTGIFTNYVTGQGISLPIAVERVEDASTFHSAASFPTSGLSLRDAVELANFLQEEGFHDQKEIYYATGSLSNGENTTDLRVRGVPSDRPKAIYIDSNVKILGPGADRLTLDAVSTFPIPVPANHVFYVNSGDVEISGFSITGAGVAGVESRSANLSISDTEIYGNAGVGLRSTSAGVVEVQSSTLAENGSHGVLSYVDTTIVNSTISGNQQAGIAASLGDISVVNTTIANNAAVGINAAENAAAPPAVIRLDNTIVVANAINGSRIDIAEFFSGYFNAASSHNLIGRQPTSGSPFSNGANGNKILVESGLTEDDHGLATLHDNGGPTRTHALLAGSPAIDSASDALAPANDQRGLRRHDDAVDGAGVADIGAVEYLPRNYVRQTSGGQFTYSLTTLSQDAIDLAGTGGNYRFFYRLSDPLAGEFRWLQGSSPKTQLQFDGSAVDFGAALSQATVTLHPRYTGVVQLLADVQEVSASGLGEKQTFAVREFFVYPEVLWVNSLSDGSDANPGDAAADTGRWAHRRETTLRAALDEIKDLHTVLSNAGEAAGWTPSIQFSEEIAGSTIRLDPTLGEFIAPPFPLEIRGPSEGPITIDANGSAEQPNRAFYVGPSGDLRLADLVITGGYITPEATTRNGGAIRAEGPVHLTRVSLTGNTVIGGVGGAVYTSGGDLSLIDSEVVRNRAAAAGGLYLAGALGESYLLSGSTLAYNEARDDEDLYNPASAAGAVFAGRSSSAPSVSLRIENTTFSHNSADRRGGLYTYNVLDVSIEHSTFAYNHSVTDRPGGIEIRHGLDPTGLDPATISVRNALFVENTRGAAGTLDDYFADTAGITTDYAGNITTASIGMTGFSQETGASIDLADLADNGAFGHTHALKAGSAAINSGATTSVATDQRAATRDGTPDVGAYENIAKTQTGDFDGDGRIDDLMFEAGGGRLFVDAGGNDDGAAEWGVAPIAEFNDARIGDFNGDGRDDVAYRDNADNWVFAFSETNRFVFHATAVDPAWTEVDLLVGDFDGDGADELIGRAAATANWGLLDLRDGAIAFFSDIGGSHRSIDYAGKVLVGDTNRDGRDDLIGITDLVNAPMSETGAQWFVRPSTDDHASGINLEGAYSWGNWFDNVTFDEIGRTIDADAPYAKVVELFNDVYNTIDTQFYRGLIKGADATAKTGRGNAWDQSALLVDRLNAIGVEADLVSGSITVGANELKALTGTHEKVAAAHVILESAENVAVNASQTTFTEVTLEHAWVQASLPTESGLATVDLDPFWKLKDLRPGVDSTPITPNGAFDELAYLAEAGDRLPITYYEDVLLDHVRSTMPSVALTDIPYDGPVVSRYDVGAPLDTDPRLAGATVTVHGDAEAIFASDSETKARTHRVRASAGGWSTEIVSARDGLKRHTLKFVGTQLQFLVDGSVVSTTTVPTGTATLTLEVARPGEAFPVSQEMKFAFSINGSGLGNLYSLALDGDQYSTEELIDRRAAINSAQSDGVSTDDIESVMQYTNATYWHSQQEANRRVVAAMQQVQTLPALQAGLVSAENAHVEGDFSHLVFSVVPRNLAVDLPGLKIGLVDTRYDDVTVTDKINPEAFQLVGWTASALESRVIESVINSDSISTVDGLLNAYRGDPLISGGGVDSVWVIDRVSDGVATKVYVRGELGKRAGEGSSKPYMPTRTDLLVTTPTQLKDYFPHHPSEAIDNLWNRLTTDVSGAARAILPERLSYAGIDAPYWQGSVFVVEKLNFSGSPVGDYIIKADGGPSMNGGYSGNDVKEVNNQINAGGSFFSNFAGDPVNVVNGNMFRDEVDIVMPNAGVPLDLARHYDAQSDYDLGFGVGWTHSFGDRLLRPDSEPNDLVWLTSNGVRHTFESSGTNTWRTPAELFGTLSLGAGVYTFVGDDGVKHSFQSLSTPIAATADDDYVARLASITDRNANGVNVIYASVSGLQISRVEDVHDSTRQLDFDYDAGGTHVTNVAKFDGGVGDVGQWNYLYETTGGDRLTKVTDPESNVLRFEYGDGGLGDGMITRIVEADGAYHEYEYYANRRVFRVTEGVYDGSLYTPQTSHSFNYDLFTETTEFVDENGVVTTYDHQDDGRLVRQTAGDGTSVLSTWGVDDGAGGKVPDTEYLMTSQTDENGRAETYEFYTGLTGGDAFKNRRLYRSKQPGPTGLADVVIEYDYSQATGVGYEEIVNLLTQKVDAYGASPRATMYDYDARGRRIAQTDAEGQITEWSYYSDPAQPRDGLLRSTTTARGTTATLDVQNEAVDWAELSGAFVVTGDSLIVEVLTDTVGEYVFADAIRIERIDGDGAGNLVEVIDDEYLGGPGFTTSNSGGSVTLVSGSNPNRYHGDATALRRNSVGDEVSATWAFTELLPGTYRVAATWADWVGNDAGVEYRLHDAAMVGATYTSVVVNQQLPPSGQSQPFFNAFETIYGYDASGSVVSRTVAGRVTEATERHHTGQVTVRLDATGVRSETAYDAIGRALSTMRSGDASLSTDDLVTSFEHDGRGRVKMVTDPLGRSIETTYDKRGDVVKTVAADGATTAYEYDPAGNRVAVTDPLGRRTEYAYDERNRLIATVFPDGEAELRRYDGAGRLIEVTDALGHKTVNAYDERGLLISTTFAEGGADEATVYHKYNRFGERIETADAEGNVTQYRYDDVGRLVKTMVLASSDAAGFVATGSNYTAVAAAPAYVQTRKYDKQGNVTEQIVYNTRLGLLDVPASQLIDPDLHSWVSDSANTTSLDPTAFLKTTYAYDHLGRQNGTTYDDGASMSTVYDAAGRVRYATDERGAVTNSGYDEYGRLVTTTLPDPDGEAGEGTSPVITRKYDSVGNLVEIIDPLGRSTRLAYDERNRLVATTDALGSTQRSVYDTAGQMVATVDLLGVAVATSYDNRGRLVERRWVDPDDDGPLTAPVVRHEYDAIGNRVATTDARGYRSTSAYDDRNRLVELRVPRAEWDSATSEVVRIGTPDPVTGLSPDDAITAYEYDDNGNLLKVTDARQFDTDYAYDELNRQVTRTLPDPDDEGTLGRLEIVTAYDGYGNVFSETEQLAGTSTTYRTDVFSYDQRNRLIGEVLNWGVGLFDADRIENAYEYDAAGNLVSEATAVNLPGVGATTRHQYDLLGRQTAVRYDAPNPDHAGRRSTEYAYDAAGNLVLETHVAREGVVAAVTDRHTLTTYAYDALNRVVSMTEDVGGIDATSTTGYDAAGNVLLRVGAAGVAMAYTYDGLYRVVQTTATDPSPYDGVASELVELLAYDSAGNVVAMANGVGDITEYAYDAAGRVLRESTAISTEGPDVTVTNHYDAAGNRDWTKDGAGNTTTFELDGWNRVTKEIQGTTETSTNTRTYEYNDEGDLYRTTDRLGRVIEYAYDGLDRVVSESWFDDDMDPTANNVLAFAYDKLGRLVAQGHDVASDAQFSDLYPDRYAESFEYDTLDRLTAHRNYLPAGGVDLDSQGVNVDGFRFNPWVDQDYHYDDFAGLYSNEFDAYRYTQMFEKSDGGGNSRDFDDVYAQTTVARDALGRVTRLVENARSFSKGVGGATVDVAAKDVVFSYDDAGRRESIERAGLTAGVGLSQVTTGFNYDPSGRIAEIKHATGPNNTEFATYGYGYDAASRIASIAATTRFGGLQLDRAEAFAYDEAGRLFDWEYTLNDLAPNYAAPGGAVDLSDNNAETHSFDGAGNRTNTGYSTGGYNRVDEDPTREYDYDAEGNVTSVWDSGRTVELRRYEWDHRNRLVRVEHDPGQAGYWNVEYGYNNDDLRVSKVVYAGDPSTVSLTVSQVEFYVWDGDQLAAVVDGSWAAGSPPSISSSGSYQRRVQNTPGAIDEALFEEAFDAASGLYWATTDHAGSVRDVVGIDLEHAEYDPHGVRLSLVNGDKQAVAEAAVDAAFAGREWDAESGLYYNRARWYDADQARFLSEDPIGLAGGDANVYRYAGGDPVSGRDPTGLLTAGNPLNTLRNTLGGILPVAGSVMAASDLLNSTFDLNFGSAFEATQSVNMNQSTQSSSENAVRHDNGFWGHDNDGDGYSDSWVGGTLQWAIGTRYGLKAPTPNVLSPGDFHTKLNEFGIPVDKPSAHDALNTGKAEAARVMQETATSVAVDTVAGPAIGKLGAATQEAGNAIGGIILAGARMADDAPGILRSVGNIAWRSSRGLMYVGRDPSGLNRVQHVLRHAVDIPNRTKHSVFDAGPKGTLAVVDEAYTFVQKGSSNVTRSNGNRGRVVYVVDMGRRVGYAGGKEGAAAGHPGLNGVQLVLENGNEVVTAHPVSVAK